MSGRSPQPTARTKLTPAPNSNTVIAMPKAVKAWVQSGVAATRTCANCLIAKTMSRATFLSARAASEARLALIERMPPSAAPSARDTLPLVMTPHVAHLAQRVTHRIEWLVVSGTKVGVTSNVRLNRRRREARNHAMLHIDMVLCTAPLASAQGAVIRAPSLHARLCVLIELHLKRTRGGAVIFGKFP